MKILYLLERSARESEVFIRREIAEVMRQGSLVEAAHRHGAWYRVERAEVIVSLHPASSGAGAGIPMPPAGVARSIAAVAGDGGRRALAHARGRGKGLGSGFRQAVALARHARRFGADVLHAHFAARASEDAMLVSWISGIPFTFTAHGYDVHLEPPPDYPERAAAASAVVTVSGDNARVLAERNGVPREAIRVVHLGVDVNRYRPRGEAEPGLLVSVMRLHPDKGCDLLLDAAGLLRKRGIDFRWEIYGDGEERARMETRLAQGLASHVQLMGWADEATLMSALSRASLFVLTSRHESLGVALLEAMACGVAAVATEVGGVPEVTDRGRCARLVPAGSPPALAEGIAALLADAPARAALGVAARERVVAAFRLDESVLRLRKVWHEATGKR
ncbi:MAG TPA: glycosyltransferase family 4 protein [Verrucomicrobiae bacterium]|nr:glycosyltransferase family 4 protein [Verrucomicrobiae bacterium]